MKKHPLTILCFLFFCTMSAQKINTILNNSICTKKNDVEYFIFQRKDSLIIAETKKDVDFLPKILLDNKCYTYKGKVFHTFKPTDSTYILNFPFINNLTECSKTIYNQRVDFIITGHIYRIVPKNKKYTFLQVYKGELNTFFQKTEYNLNRNEIPEPDVRNVPKIKQ